MKIGDGDCSRAASISDCNGLVFENCRSLEKCLFNQFEEEEEDDDARLHVNEKDLGRSEEAGIMLGYSVIQFFHPMMSKERGNGPVFTTSQLVQSFEEPHHFPEEEPFDFGDDKDSASSEEGPGDPMHYCSGLSPSFPSLTDEHLGNPTWGFTGGGHNEGVQTENQGLELVSLLTLCAESVSTANHAAINCFLSRLGELASPRGSPIQRVVAYFTEALALRVVRLWPHVFSISPPREVTDQTDGENDAIALRLLNQVSPIPRFIQFTLNERLLRAFEGKERIHIIDFDIKEGLQWPSFLQSLASRPNPPAHVRITGIGDSRQDLQDTGARLKALAESLNLLFEFHPVVDRVEDVRLWMLHVKEGECVAVNCVLQLHRALYDDNMSVLMNLLGLIRSTSPAIVLAAEEEAEHNDPRWEMRFANSLQYYSAIFDSMDGTLLPEDSAARIKIEEMFARRIRNVVSCEGVERTERHEGLVRWRELMEEGGFRPVDMGEREALQGRMLARMYASGENYGVERRGEDGNAVSIKWLDQPLYTVSAWAPVSFPGSPSASQPG